MELYLKLDVMLLCDIWLNFRKLCIENYNLSPDNYYTLPGIAFDAALRKYNKPIELISDSEMYMMIE